MLCDRDAIPPSKSKEDIEAASGGRLRLLEKYHLENYFLEETVLARVFSRMEPAGAPLTNPSDVLSMLHAIARDTLSYAAALIVSAEYRDAVGNIDIMPKGCHGKTEGELSRLILDRASEESKRVAATMDAARITESIRATTQRLEDSLTDGSGAWKQLMPGRQILNIFAAKGKISTGRLKQMYLAEAEVAKTNPFSEIISIFEHFSRL